MANCTSLPQMCLLGPSLPRIPGRADPQVPSGDVSGNVKYGRIPYVYFYTDAGKDDAAYGMLDIEFALYRTQASNLCIELYCIGDGFQSGTGTCNGHPLSIKLRTGDELVARADWFYPDIMDGHADPVHFTTTLHLPEADFTKIENIYIPPAKGSVR